MRLYLFIIFSLLLISSGVVSDPAQARNHEQPRTISVSGSGTVAAIPDMATIRVGVSTRDASPAKALKDNNAKVAKLFEALERFGIQKRDIQTSSFNVNPVHTRRRPPNTPPKIEAYDVSNSVTVRLRDLDKLGALLDALVTAGANRLNGISFGVSDLDDKTNEARKLAVKDAKARAELYAQEADVDVGKVMSISESSIRRPRPMMQMRAMSAESVPIARGEQTISASVTVVFEID